jgi:hypothetical protein
LHAKCISRRLVVLQPKLPMEICRCRFDSGGCGVWHEQFIMKNISSDQSDCIGLDSEKRPDKLAEATSSA